MKLKDINIGTLGSSISMYSSLVRLGVINHAKIWRTYRTGWNAPKGAYLSTWNPSQDGFREGGVIIGIIGLAGDGGFNVVFSGTMLVDSDGDSAFVLTDLAAIVIGEPRESHSFSARNCCYVMDGYGLLPYCCAPITEDPDPKSHNEGFWDCIQGVERTVDSYHMAHLIELALQGRSYPWVGYDA